jgi:hypothetical protein
MRNEYEFDYENEIGNWLSEQSSSQVFDTTKQTVSSSRSSANDVDGSTGWSYVNAEKVSDVKRELASPANEPKPKTSKEILKEIIRLTNGTTPSQSMVINNSRQSNKSDSIKSTKFEHICHLNKSSDQLKNSKN